MLHKDLKFVASSVAEAKLGSLFFNVKEECMLELTSAELGHPQPLTPTHCDNASTIGHTNNSIKSETSISPNGIEILLQHWSSGKENMLYTVSPWMKNLWGLFELTAVLSRHISKRLANILAHLRLPGISYTIYEAQWSERVWCWNILDSYKRGHHFPVIPRNVSRLPHILRPAWRCPPTRILLFMILHRCCCGIPDLRNPYWC